VLLASLTEPRIFNSKLRRQNEMAAARYSQVRGEVFEMPDIPEEGVYHRLMDDALSHSIVSPALWKSFRQDVVDVSVRIGKT
jgi:hypothetical protein